MPRRLGERTRAALFTASVAVVCTLVVSATSVTLAERQARNEAVERKRQVLLAAGVLAVGQRVSTEGAHDLFAEHVRPRALELGSGRYVPELDPATLHYHERITNPEEQHLVPENPAGVATVPNHIRVYEIVGAGEQVQTVVVPIHGAGLWATMYGYLAMDRDGRTIRGIAYYEHAETPGLGGEVDTERWRALWPGRVAYDATGAVRIRADARGAGPPETDPHRVDVISGATLTSRAVGDMLGFWLGPRGYGPLFRRLREGGPT